MNSYYIYIYIYIYTHTHTLIFLPLHYLYSYRYKQYYFNLVNWIRILNNLHSLTLNVGWDGLRKLLVLVAVTGSAGSDDDNGDGR